MTKYNLNKKEIKVLKSLVDSSKANGHDFGFTDEYKDCGLTKHQVAGYIGQLSKKGYLELYEMDGVGSDGIIKGVQFIFTKKVGDLLGLDLPDRY